MSVSAVSAVLYAKDQAKVAAFYRDTLGLPRTTSEADHTILACGGFDLVIHQTPRPIVDTVTITAPPKRRDGGAIRLNFTVNSVAAARQIAASLGGQVDDTPPAWAPGGAKLRLGHDPEGNVFLVNE